METEIRPDNEKSPNVVHESKFLGFSLGQERFAVPLTSVREVIAVPSVTAIPHTPPYFLGITDLRGQVISVMDLRTKFNIKPLGGAETAVIIFDVGSSLLGVVVDSVDYVFSPNRDEISDKPTIESAKNTDYIQGVIRHDKDLVLMLDIGKALGPEDRNAITRAASHKK